MVVVRPDQYVAAVLPLEARDELARYFEGHLLEPKQQPTDGTGDYLQRIEIQVRVEILH